MAGLVALILGLVAVAAASVGWQARAVRRRRVVAQLREAGAALDAPPAEGPFGQVRAAVLRAVLVERGSAGVVAQVHGAVPRLEAGPAGATPEDEVGRLDGFLERLNRNSAAVAGAEQTLLWLIDAAGSDPVVLSAALATLGDVVPAELARAGQAIVEYLHSPELLEHLQHAAVEFGQDVLMEVGHSMPHIVEAFATHHAATAFEHFGDIFGEESMQAAAGVLLHGVVDLAAPVGEHVGVILDTVDGAGFAAGVADAHFPWITATLSSIRQIRAVSDGRTQLGDGVANVAREVGSTATGAYLGLLGDLVVPGSSFVLVPLLAWAFRKISNDIAEEDLRAAQAQYRKIVDGYQSRIRTLTTTLAAATRQHAGQDALAFRAALPARPSLADEPVLRPVAYLLLAAAQVRVGELRAMLAAARPIVHSRPELESDRHRLAAAMPGIERAIEESRRRADGGDYLGALIGLAGANLPAPPRWEVGPRVVRDLDAVSCAHARSTQEWLVIAGRTYGRYSQDVAGHIGQDYEAFTRGVTGVRGEVERAAAAVTRERNRLGRK